VVPAIFVFLVLPVISSCFIVIYAQKLILNKPFFEEQFMYFVFPFLTAASCWFIGLVAAFFFVSKKENIKT